MINRCPVCRKEFDVLWPHMWRYKRGAKTYCSWSCLRADETKGSDIMSKITLENKKTAVQLAIKGKNPLEYLKQCGSKAPDKTWYAIKAALKKTDPELYAQIPDFRKKAEETEPVNVTGPVQIEPPEALMVAVETPEGPKDFGKLIRENRYTVTAISYPDIGEFYYDRKYNSIDWRTIEGDEVSMSPTGWKILIQDLPEIMKLLGVEL